MRKGERPFFILNSTTDVKLEMLMRYIFVKQHDSTDCAAACLAMVCLYYKKSITISKLRDLMGTDIKGTNLIGLSQCADSLGFASRAVRVDKKGLRSRYTLPCIANVKTDGGYSHFVDRKSTRLNSSH